MVSLIYRGSNPTRNGDRTDDRFESCPDYIKEDWWFSAAANKNHKWLTGWKDNLVRSGGVSGNKYHYKGNNPC
jgi:hypothetical protein